MQFDNRMKRFAGFRASIHTALTCLAVGLPSFLWAESPQNLNLVTSFSFPGGSLIKNGSFENNYANYAWEAWTINKEASPGNHAGIFDFLPYDDPQEPYNGRRMAGVRFTRPEPSSYSPYLVSDLFPVRPGKFYTLFIRFRASYEAGSGIYPVFLPYQSRNQEEAAGPSLPGTPYAESQSWALSVHRFETPSEANYAEVALLQGGTGGTHGRFYFDDVLLVEGCPRASAGETLPAGCDDVPFGQDPRHPDFVSIGRKFLDGNNKLVQAVTQDGVRDIVTHNIYDRNSRIEKSTLPIGGNFGQFQHDYIPGIKANHSPGDFLANFYNQNPVFDPSDPNSDPLKTFDPRVDEPLPGQTEGAPYPEADGVAFSQTRYENSPLGRVREISRPGERWAMGMRTIRSNYSSAASLDDAERNNLPLPPADNSGNFFITEVIDAEHQVAREITDKSGKVVRSISLLDVEEFDIFWAATDYEYDANGNLVQVLSPEVSGNRLTTSMDYDFLNRMVSETTPSTGTTRFHYDDLGRLRFSQTAKQETSGRFTFVKYDELGRVLQTGEVLDATWFTVEAANIPEFPCAVNCSNPTSIIDPAKLKFRTLSHYDTENARLTCQGDLSGAPGEGGPGGSPGGTGEMAFLARNPAGVAIAAGYDFLLVYETAVQLLQGTQGEGSILALYDPDGATEVVPPTGSEFDLQFGDLTFTFEGVSLETQEGMDAWAIFNELLASQTANILGEGEYLQGRLVKTLSCNHELSIALGESVPREVSKTFRYDKFGNITRIMEVNGYLRNATQRTQAVKNEYDIQNRLSRKIICGNILTCDDFNPEHALNHTEQYQYDQLGRLAKVLDKAGNDIVHNHYNYIGQLSAQGIGASLGAEVPNALNRKNEYHLQGWLLNHEYSKRDPGSTVVFREDLGYEAEGTGITPRFDGNISSATYTYAPSTTSLAQIQYAYKYDVLNRLTDAMATSADASASYEYLDDGRLAFMSLGTGSGTYGYDLQGRLREVQGNLVPDRDMGLDGTSSKFSYDENGNLEEDRSKMHSGQPLEIYYRDDNLPYMFKYGFPNSSQQHTAYMAYDETGSRISKLEYSDNAWQSEKIYFGLGKEVRQRSDGTALSFYNSAGMARVRYSETEAGGNLGFREFYLLDRLGSTRGVYSSAGSGNLVFASHYHPYGRPFRIFSEQSIQDGDVTEKFTGKELDEDLGLMYFGARYYDPDIGLWISPDPARQFHSPYAYSANPINSIDPDGMASYTTVDENMNVVNHFQDGNFSDKRALVLQNGKVISEGLMAPPGGFTSESAIEGRFFNPGWFSVLRNMEVSFMEGGHFAGIKGFTSPGAFNFKFSPYRRLDTEIGFAYGHLVVPRDAGNMLFGRAVRSRYGILGYGIAKEMAGVYNLCCGDGTLKQRLGFKFLQPHHSGEDPRTGEMNDFGAGF